MKLKVIIPLSGLDSESVESKKEYLKRFIPDEVTLDVECLTEGPHCLMSEIDSATAIPIVAKHVIRAEKEGYSGVFIDCFDDPGLRAYRELVNIPVIGAFESSLSACQHLFDSAIIISPEVNTVPSTEYKVKKSEYYSLIRKVHGLECNSDIEEQQALAEIIKKYDSKTDAIILGCTAFYHYYQNIKEISRVSQIIEPSSVSILQLYGLAKCEYVNGRITYSHSN